jgi:tetratricopeptide (TPR) repeat protein
MKKFTVLVFVVFLFFFTFSYAENSQDANSYFKQGLNYLESGNYNESINSFKRVLDILPKEETTLYNIGMASFLAKKYEDSVKYWGVLEGITPNDYEVKYKIIQAYEQLNQMDEVKRRINIIHKDRATSNDQTFLQKKKFCRDQFVVDGIRYFGYEHFGFMTEQFIKYTIGNLTPDGKQDNIYTFITHPSDVNKLMVDGVEHCETMYFIEKETYSNESIIQNTVERTCIDHDYYQFKSKIIQLIKKSL